MAYIYIYTNSSWFAIQSGISFSPFVNQLKLYLIYSIYFKYMKSWLSITLYLHLMSSMLDPRARLLQKIPKIDSL